MGEASTTYDVIKAAFSGSVANIVARFVGQPLDVLKIRFQLQNVKDGKIKYRGLISSTALIAREEGYSALWKGLVPAQLLSIIYGAVQFPLYEVCKSNLRGVCKRDNSPFLSVASADFFAGGIAGVSATLVCQPIDVVRTRLVAQSKKKVYSSMREAFILMFKENGVRTYFKGIVPTIGMIFPNSGLQFAFYGVYQLIWETLNFPDMMSLKLKHLVCGGLSGTTSKLILLPFDNIKKRLQIQGFPGHPYIKGGMFKIICTVVREQGFFGLYRGVVPSVLKSAVFSGIIFYVYEQMRELTKETGLTNV